MRVILKPYTKDEDTNEIVPDEIYVTFDDWEEDYILQSQKDRQLYIVNKNRILKEMKD